MMSKLQELLVVTAIIATMTATVCLAGTHLMNAVRKVDVTDAESIMALANEARTVNVYNIYTMEASEYDN